MGALISVFSAVVSLLTGKTKYDERNKFKIQDGVTLYDNDQSPCARRVRMTLLEKGIKFRKVEVDLLKGEQMSSEFKKISPNKKVPAASFKNVPGIEDCIVFESNVITELLDADNFGGPKLYPANPWQRAQVKMWQDWELGLVDDFVPFVYQNMLPFILSLIHPTKEVFLATLPKETPPAKREHWVKTYDAKIASPEKLEQHAIACYQNLCQLEAALEGKQFLVGNRFTTADLSVLPRVIMYNSIGLTIRESDFPNVTAYIRRLSARLSILHSQSFGSKMGQWVMSTVPSILVKLGNWRTGRNLQRFDGLKVVNRAVSEYQSGCELPSWLGDASRLGEDDVLVADCAVSPSSWLLKLLLMEKGVRFSSSTVEAIDMISRWSGSGGMVRVQHGQRCVVGIRATVDYLDSVFGTGEYLPADPLQRAQVQCWQAWAQTMGYQELGPLIESTVITQNLLRRYEGDLSSLLELRSQPQYKTRFSSILQCFISGLSPNAPLLSQLREEYDSVIKAAQAAIKEQDSQRALLMDRLQHLEKSLQDQRYLVGGRLTLADLLLFCHMAFFPFVGLKVASDMFPNITDWMANLETRPAIKQVAQSIATVCQA